MSTIFHVLGWCLAHCPKALLRVICCAFGWMVFHASSRRRIILENLFYAFPQLPERVRHKLARENCNRLAEMFLLPLAQPHFSLARLRRDYALPPETLTAFKTLKDAGNGVIFCIPHATMAEGSTALPGFVADLPPVTALYRPLDFPPLDRAIKRAREAFGAKLRSRKEGLLAARDSLASGGGVAILFDQNARGHGYLTPHFGRCASVTNLPGLLAAKYKAPCVLLFARRTGFWKASFHIRTISPGTPAHTTLAINRALEEALEDFPDFRTDYFWAHNRWKVFDSHQRRLSIDHPKSYLKEHLQELGLAAMPRRTTLAFWMPSDAATAVAFAPFIPQIRASRPDARLVLLLPHSAWFIHQTLKTAGADSLIQLPGTTHDRRQLLRTLACDYWESLFIMTPETLPLKEAPLTRTRYISAILPENTSKPPQMRFLFRLPPQTLFNPETAPAIWQSYFARHGLTSA